MKKRLSAITLISIISCLLIMFAITAVAATPEKSIDNLDVIENIEFDEISVDSIKLIEDKAQGFQLYEVAIEDEILEIYTEKNSLPLRSIENYINKANYAIEQELAINEEAGQDAPDVIEYIYSDGDVQVTYLEGTTEDGTYAKAMFITDALSVDEFTDNIGKSVDSFELDEEALVKNSMISTAAVDDSIPGGIGIRAVANQDGQYMTGSFANCPALNANSSLSYFHYFGFTKGTIKSDIGVMYSPAKKGWLPYFLLKQNGNTYMISSTTPGVTVVGYELDGLANGGYGMTSPITLTVYKSVKGYNNGLNNGAETVRLTTKGTRETPLTQNVMCIVEAGSGISTSVEWRALTTIAGSSILAGSNPSAPRIEMNYSGVKIGTASATWKSTEVDSAVIISKGTGYIRGKVNFQ